MSKMNIQIIGTKLREQRGSKGVREVAEEVGISAATLSRVERGHLPDIETFGKVCRWLHLDPNEVLGVRAQSVQDERTKAMVHFRKDRTLRPETAQALGHLILAAQRALSSTAKE
jgi:transcriptional regulator with XRE-family HTH domain